MAFDASLDVVIHTEHVPADRPAEEIELKVASYNSGPPKLQITRSLTGSGKHVKLGRMSKDEMVRVRDAMTKLLEMQLDEEEPMPECLKEETGDETQSTGT